MENLVFGLEVMLIGFAGVFVALSALYFILVLLDRFFSKKNGKAGTPLPGASGDMMPLAPPKSQAEDDLSGELVAVITAAILTYTDKPMARLAIKTIAPAGQANAWVHYGRSRNMDLKSSVSVKRREKRA